jgi:hypothetical protein
LLPLLVIVVLKWQKCGVFSALRVCAWQPPQEKADRKRQPPL